MVDQERSSTLLPVGVPVAVVAHPARIRQADEVADRTQAEALILDDASYGAAGNHRRALQWLAAGNPSVPFSVILEDDTLPIQNFQDQLAKMLMFAPTPIVGLYLGRHYPPHWQPQIARALGPVLPPLRRDVCFLLSSELLHAVGYAIRTDLLEDLVQFLPPEAPDVDEAISRWARFRGHQVSHCWPSLVDHRDGLPVIKDRQDGLLRQEPRVAWKVGWRRQWNSTTAIIEDPERETG